MKRWKRDEQPKPQPAPRLPKPDPALSQIVERGGKDDGTVKKTG